MKTRKINKIALLDVPFNIAAVVFFINRFRMMLQSGLQQMVDADEGGVFMMAAAVVLFIAGLIFDLKCLLSDRDDYGYNKAFVMFSFIIKIVMVIFFVIYRLIA